MCFADPAELFGVKKSLACLLTIFPDIACWVAEPRDEATFAGEAVHALQDHKDLVGLVGCAAHLQMKFGYLLWGHVFRAQ
ncbi:MAG: hypothetical protein BGP04_12400 [Rhizobiales bacterium 62-17]|nr:MAG: hypothetical protein BGP04_12400 [Rhizobiales bacterium 62-17]